MLRHTFLRLGEDISLQHLISSSFNFLLCLSVYLVLYCLLASKSKARDGNKGNKELYLKNHYGPILQNGFKEGSKVYKFCLKVILYCLSNHTSFFLSSLQTQFSVNKGWGWDFKFKNKSHTTSFNRTKSINHLEAGDQGKMIKSINLSCVKTFLC